MSKTSNIVAVISCVATVGSLYLAYLQYNKKETAETELSKAISREYEERSKRLQAERELREEIEKEKDSLRLFEKDYRNHISAIMKAKNEYEKLDTVQMRRELGAKELENRKKERFQDLKNSISSFIDFVKKWRSVQSSLQSLINGEIDQLETVTQANNEKEIMNTIDIIMQKVEGDMTVLEEALKKALKNPNDKTNIDEKRKDLKK